MSRTSALNDFFATFQMYVALTIMAIVAVGGFFAALHSPTTGNMFLFSGAAVLSATSLVALKRSLESQEAHRAHRG